ncbi:MAG: DNA gyrase subunit B [Gemmataceae bacterium]|nr:DNA gyrase subunit B [Gemmataceae bacterium]
MSDDHTFDETTTSLSEAQAAATAIASEDYGGDNVQVLRDAAHIRRRPGVYIGDVGPAGLHHLVYELVYNSVDEALAGYCYNIHVQINVDGSLSVSDDGRGIPVDPHPEEGRPTLEVVLTKVGAGAKFDKRTYQTSAGLHGMGAKAVTALSEWVEAKVRRNSKVYVQEYERGKAITEVKEMGVAKRTGTEITFKPDPEIFHDLKFDYDRLESRLREIAFLNKGLSIKLTDEASNKEATFHYAGGVAEFVEYLNSSLSEDPLHKPIYIDRIADGVRVETALQYTEKGEEERVRCYANNAYNVGGGTHLSGFRGALTRALKDYGGKENLFKSGLEPVGEDFREGLTAVVSVQVPEPQFESQTKIRLNNPEVEGIVGSVIYECLKTYLEENPKEAKKIINKVVLAAQAREAAAKARKAAKDRKSILNSGGLPGKLYDCTDRDRDDSELFLVEGLSAGGTAVEGRNSAFQAILPLRGKVLNVEKARLEKVLSNEEICNLISAVGIDIENSEDTGGLRYGKVILLSDADVDGQHIRTLILTFFYRQMRKLIEDGRIFVARPPLYKVAARKSVRFVQNAEEMIRELMDRGLAGTKLHVAALQAGPGVTPREAVTLEGERLGRLVEVLTELEEKGLAILERRGLSLAALLERAAGGPLPVYRVQLGGHEHWFVTAEEVDAFRLAEQQRLGHELVVGDELRPGGPSKNGNGNGSETLYVQELHEVRRINQGTEKLRALGLRASDLVPLPRVAGREPPVRFVLEAGDSRRALGQLRELVAEVRRLGERGLSVTRFKGLGEMDARELWDTTLNPEARTLVKVRLEDADEAEKMFRTLMGEKVEPRREFIQKHALEVKDLDYHGA